MTDFWLSKLFFDLQDAALRTEFRAEPEAVMARYKLPPEVRRAVMANDLGFIAPRVNAYLLRYYCGYMAMPEDEFLSRIRATRPSSPPTPPHG